jgi:predicted nucleotidyltransferase
MKNFTEFFVESILDPEQPTLSPQIFDVSEEPKLNGDVRTQIMVGISKLSELVNVLDYTLIGSILTRRYANDSDIDVNVLINASQDKFDAAKELAIELSGKTVNNTKHPINYHVLSDVSDFENANNSADGVFDISKNVFIRKPIDKPFHVEKYFTAFKDVVSKIDVLKDDLKDDLIDYSMLKTLSTTDVSEIKDLIRAELLAIETDVRGLEALHNKIIADRNDAFQKKLTANDIRQYGTKNRLPSNVIYKLLERHHYLTFLHEVEKVLSDGKITDSDVDKLIDVVF